MHFAKPKLFINIQSFIYMHILCASFSVPLPPCCFNISDEYHDTVMTTVTLDWNPPVGSGPEFLIDNYTISISPDPPFQPAISSPLLPPWNVTLDHNRVYTINITSLNCAGESVPVTLHNIGFSKRISDHYELSAPFILLQLTVVLL